MLGPGLALAVLASCASALNGEADDDAYRIAIHGQPLDEAGADIAMLRWRHHDVAADARRAFLDAGVPSTDEALAEAMTLGSAELSFHVYLPKLIAPVMWRWEVPRERPSEHTLRAAGARAAVGRSPVHALGRVVCMVPARVGSGRLPLKNLEMLEGRFLVE